MFSGEEIISDSFEITPVFDGVGGEVKSKLVSVGGVNVDIGCGDAFGKGAAEEGEEEGGVEDKEEKVNNLIDAFKYRGTPFTKSEYLPSINFRYTQYIKGYMKKVKEHLETSNPSRVQPFMKGAQEMVKWILSNFADFEFYTPESYDNENIIILSYYKGEDHAPTFVYFMDGLKECKF